MHLSYILRTSRESSRPGFDNPKSAMSLNSSFKWVRVLRNISVAKPGNINTILSKTQS